MKRVLANPWTPMVLRLFLGGIFLWAGLVKIQGMGSFADNIDAFKLFPAAIVNLLAVSLPLLEIIIGGMLLIGWQKRQAAFAGMLLLAVFTLVLLQAQVRGLTVDCGCFGDSNDMKSTPWVALGRDLVLLAGAVLLYLRIAWVEPAPVGE